MWVTGKREALARPFDDTALQPVRLAFWMGRDHELVGGERAERVLDRLERVAVADLAVAVIPAARIATSEASSRCWQPRPCAVLVGNPVLERRVQRGHDDEHVLVDALRARAGAQ